MTTTTATNTDTETNLDRVGQTGGLLRVRAVTERLDVSRATIYRLIASGELAAVRIGRAVRVPADAVEEYIAKNLTI